MKIYVASSWRTPRHDEVVKALRDAGHSVYNYREPPAFAWEKVDPGWTSWNIDQYLDALNSKEASSGFWKDFDAMNAASVFVGVEPFGVSASLELGWAAGRGKTTILLANDKEVKPELMLKMLTFRTTSLSELKNLLEVIHE